MRIPDLNDIPDLAPVEPAEYDFEIISAKDAKASTGREGIKMTLSLTGEELAENVFHNLWYPMEGDDDGKVKTMWRMVKDFMVDLGLPIDGSVETKDFVGITGTGYFDLEWSDHHQRNINVLKRIV